MTTTTDYITFILFAEMIGVVSPLVEWADKKRKGGKLKDFQEDILRREASVLLGKVKDKYSSEEILEWWDVFVAITDKPLGYEDLPF